MNKEEELDATASGAPGPAPAASAQYTASQQPAPTAESTEAFDATIEDLRDLMFFSSLSYNNIAPSVLHIATLTLTVTIRMGIKDLYGINTEDLQTFKKNFEESQYEKVQLTGCDDLKETRFHNCRILKFQKNGRKNVMIFCNGSLQITGCKTVAEAKHISGLVCKSLLQIGQITELPAVETSMIKANLINSNFRLGQAINLDSLQASLVKNKEQISMVSTDRQTHSAVNIAATMKNGVVVKIFVFCRGNVVITGVKNPAHLMEAYDAICSFVDNHFIDIAGSNDIFLPKVPKKRGRKRKADQDKMYENLAF